VLVGFGIDGAATARELGGAADGVIVGSALLRALGELRGEAAARAGIEFLGPFRKALDRR
jgi:tryptophan synthase alpha chain